MELNIQKYLRSGKTPDDLKDELAINHRRHSKYNNLVSFKYDQLDSPRGHEIIKESRGIILDEDNNWNVVAFPFKRFFNLNEGHADKIDWPSATVCEKMDGSLCTLYSHNNQWQVATGGSADAGGNVGDGLVKWVENGVEMPYPQSFADYFWCVSNLRFGAGWNLSAPEDYCFMFELTGPLNRIVVYHESANLTLLGARNVKTGQEITAKEAASFFKKVPYVREFKLSSVDEIVASFENISPLSQEGYVVYDKEFHRIKMKSPAYVALHHMKDGLTTKAFVEIARSGETSEVMSAFPEYRPLLEDAEARFDCLLQKLEWDYKQIKHIEVQKEFALCAKNTRCPAALFALRSGKVNSIKEYLRKIRIDNLLNLLGYKNEAAS